MSRFKIGGEDILVGWRDELQNVYRINGLQYAKEYLDFVIKYINERPIYGKELLPALMRTMIVQKILKEANDDNRTGEPVGRSYGRA